MRAGILPFQSMLILVRLFLFVFLVGVVLFFALSYNFLLRWSKEHTSSLVRETCNFKTLLIPGIRGPVVENTKLPHTVDYSRLGNAESSCWSQYQNIYHPQGKVQEQLDSSDCKIGSFPLVIFDGLILEGVPNAPKEYHTQGFVPDMGEKWDHFTALFLGPAATDNLMYDDNLPYRNFSCHFEETGESVHAYVTLQCRDYHTGCMRLFALRCGLSQGAIGIYGKASQVMIRVCDDTCGMCASPMILRGQSLIKGDLGVVVTERIFASSPAERTAKKARLATWMHHYLTQGATHFIWIDNGQFAEETALNFLEPYIRKGIVSWHWWPYPPFVRMQIPAYNMALYRYRGFRWLIQCDSDEFLVLGPAASHFRTMKNFLLSGVVASHIAVVGVSHIYVSPWDEKERPKLPLEWTGISDGPMKYSDRGKQIYRPAITWFIGIHEPQLPFWSDSKRTWHIPWDLLRLYHARRGVGGFRNRSHYLASSEWPPLVCKSVTNDDYVPLEVRKTLCQ